MNEKKLMIKNILVGVCGGVAAYKTCELVRLLIQQEFQVKVVMTSHAQQFIHANTFAALSGSPVYDNLFESEDAMRHITLARWADQIIIAPASASTLSKLATGIADNLLTTICLASNAPCYIVPAMNKVMWEKPSIQENILKLQKQNYHIIFPEFGNQACGDIGMGRMQSPEKIVEHVTNHQKKSLSGLCILITAGPTQEAIDPVRYLSNYSSGKMGFALAQAAQEEGAETTLIAGPVALNTPVGCHRLNVTNTEEMLNAVLQNIPHADIFISAAAVADYRAKEVITKKLKKETSILQLTLEKNPDILSIVSSAPNKPYLIGFCAETENLVENAQEKLIRKNLDGIVANQIHSNHFPFSANENEVIYISKNNTISFPKENKIVLARKILMKIAQDYRAAYLFKSQKPEKKFEV